MVISAICNDLVWPW